MKTILVPTDGSSAAEKALELALDLAEKHGAHLKLMHVLLRDKEPIDLLRLPQLGDAEGDVVSALQTLAEAPEIPRSAEEQMRDPGAPDRPVPDALLQTIGTHVLNRASSRAGARGVPFELLDIADGAAALAIAAIADTEQVDTIVMGTRGLRQIEAMTFGSVSQQVCQTVGCTCVAVH